MKRSFLDYYKLILDKVSFNHALFKKEYKKAVNTLHYNEVENLNRWLKSKGYGSYLLERVGSGSNSIRADMNFVNDDRR